MDHAGFESLCRYVLLEQGQGGSWIVTVALVSDDALRKLHARFIDEDSITDVMTFPPANPGMKAGISSSRLNVPPNRDRSMASQPTRKSDSCSCTVCSTSADGTTIVLSTGSGCSPGRAELLAGLQPLAKRVSRSACETGDRQRRARNGVERPQSAAEGELLPRLAGAIDRNGHGSPVDRTLVRRDVDRNSESE